MTGIASPASLHEGTIDVPTLQSLARVARVNLLEIQAHRSSEEPSGTIAAGASRIFWKDLLWLPDVRDFAHRELLRERLGALGLDIDDPVVVYGEHRQYGFYARWALRHAGLRPVFVLERPELLTHALPIPSLASGPVPTIESAASPRRALRQDVLEALRLGNVQIVDARSREEYDGWRVSPPGSEDHGAERAGHIPGALHLHYKDLIDEAGALKSTSVLRGLANAAGLHRDRPVIAYCRLSHRASLLTFVLQEKLGFEDVRLYDGSWTEWGSTVGSPIEHNRPA